MCEPKQQTRAENTRTTGVFGFQHSNDSNDFFPKRFSNILSKAFYRLGPPSQATVVETKKVGYVIEQLFDAQTVRGLGGVGGGWTFWRKTFREMISWGVGIESPTMMVYKIKESGPLAER